MNKLTQDNQVNLKRGKRGLELSGTDFLKAFDKFKGCGEQEIRYQVVADGIRHVSEMHNTTTKNLAGNGETLGYFSEDPLNCGNLENMTLDVYGKYNRVNFNVIH